MAARGGVKAQLDENPINLTPVLILRAMACGSFLYLSTYSLVLPHGITATPPPCLCTHTGVNIDLMIPEKLGKSIAELSTYFPHATVENHFSPGLLPLKIYLNSLAHRSS